MSTSFVTMTPTRTPTRPSSSAFVLHDDADDAGASPFLSERKRRRRKHRPLPPQFRPELPMSARKRPPEQPEEDGDLGGFRTMDGSSFYGKKKNDDEDEGSVRRRPSVSGIRALRKEKIDEDESQAGPSTPKTSRLKPATPKSEPPPAKKKKPSQSPAATVVRRQSSSSSSNSSSSSRKRRSQSSFGMNKGVGHAIKKPKPSKKKEPAKARSPPAPKTPKTPKTPKLPRVNPLLKQATAAATSPVVGSLTPNVNYVLKNGQYQFIRRNRIGSQTGGQSPSPASSPSATTLRKTPAKLFSPSGSGDYLKPTEGSPSRSPRKPKFIPSPVKFHRDAAEEEEQPQSDMSGLIDTLDVDDERPASAMQTPVKSSDYAVLVSEEEMGQVHVQRAETDDVAREAWDAVRDLEELALLDHSGMATDPDTSLGLHLQWDDDSSNGFGGGGSKENVSPTKNITDSPRRNPPRPRNPSPAKSSPSKRVLRTPSKVSMESVRTPTKNSPARAVTPSKRTPVKVAETTTSKLLLTPTRSTRSSAASTAKQTPAGSAAGHSTPRSSRSQSKVYSVFQKGAKTGIADEAESVSVGRGSRSTARHSLPGDQMIIDAGQKQIGSRQCDVCKFFYLPGDANEERLHKAAHDTHMGVIPFPGWKTETVVQEDAVEGWKVVLVKPQDPKRHWEKVQSVVEVVDLALGVTTGIQRPERSEALLYIQAKEVVGFLLAEGLSPTDKVFKSFLSKRKMRFLSDELKSVDKRKMCGVSRVWVRDSHRRKGVATKLVDVLRRQYRRPLFLRKEELVFSPTTDMGAGFAAKYMKTPDFLVYRHV